MYILTLPQISGSTDGGIVIFGAPGSQFIGNSITSSETDEGFGAINMVDFSYNGNYSGVVVSDNTIKGVGTGFFSLGIGIGHNVWSNPNDDTYFGPATVTNNTFIGNIGFSIVVDGWSGGLTVSFTPLPRNPLPRSMSIVSTLSDCQLEKALLTSTGDGERCFSDHLTNFVLRRRKQLPSTSQILIQRQ